MGNIYEGSIVRYFIPSSTHIQSSWLDCNMDDGTFWALQVHFIHIPRSTDICPIRRTGGCKKSTISNLKHSYPPRCVSEDCKQRPLSLENLGSPRCNFFPTVYFRLNWRFLQFQTIPPPSAIEGAINCLFFLLLVCYSLAHLDPEYFLIPGLKALSSGPDPTLGLLSMMILFSLASGQYHNIGWHLTFNWSGIIVSLIVAADWALGPRIRKELLLHRAEYESMEQVRTGLTSWDD